MTSGTHSVRAGLRTANVATFLFSTCGAFFLLLPVYLHQAGSSPAQIGLVAGILRASSLLARPVGGRLLDRFGRRPVTVAGTILAIVAVLSLFVFPQVGLPFLSMRALQGVGTALLDLGLSTLVADLSPPAARAQVFAIFTAWMNLAGAVMPGAGEIIARHGGFPILFGTAALALTGGLIAVWRLPETVRSRRERADKVPGVLKGAAPLLLGGTVIGVAFGVLSVFVPVSRIGMAPGRTGLFFFTYFLGLLGLRTAAGLGLTWLTRPRMLLPAYAIMVVGLLALPLGDSVLLLLSVGLVCGATHGVLVPILYALMLFGTPRDRRGWSIALLGAAFDLGNVVGAMGLGLVAERLGFAVIFVLAGAIVAGGALVSHVWGAR